MSSDGDLICCLTSALEPWVPPFLPSTCPGKEWHSLLRSLPPRHPLTNPQDMGDGESSWVPVCQAPPELLLGQSSKIQDPWVAVTMGHIYSADSEEFLHLLSVTCTAIKLRLKGQNPYVEGVGAGVSEQGGWHGPPLGVWGCGAHLHTHHPSVADLSPLMLTPLSPQMVFCFSPVGHTLRVRARKFPAIVNCTAIDWFHAWPQEALISVSRRFIEEMEGIEVGCVSLR